MGIHSLKINNYWILDNLCYPHFEQGPCAPGEQFRAHPKETGYINKNGRYIINKLFFPHFE